MSRSYKKHPIIKARGRYTKTDSARRFRRTVGKNIEQTFNRADYKKVLRDVYDVCDWSYYWSLEEALAAYYKKGYWSERFPTEEEFIFWWKKTYINK